MSLIESLNWRYATKRMTGEKVSEDKVNQILESIRLAPSAYGLQPYNLLVIEDKDMLNKIYEEACPQIVIKQCSHLIVFKALKKIKEEVMEGYIEEMVRVRDTSEEENDKFREKIQKVMDNPDINKFSWTIRQAYLGLGYATFAAAQLRVDSTPIEGFNASKLNEVLGLNTNIEEAVVLVTLGYRDEKEDRTLAKAKVRQPAEKFIRRI
mgnify:FL=1